jgi:hypothetical protein
VLPLFHIMQVVSAPTGAGKTGVMELAMLRLLSKHLSGPAGHPPASLSDRPRTQLQFKPMDGSHKIVYLGAVSLMRNPAHPRDLQDAGACSPD